MAFASSLAAFGMKPATTSTTSSVFGQPQQQTGQQQSSLFSGLGQNQQQNQPQQSTSLFGQPQQPANQPQQQPGGLFGQTQTSSGPGLFGQTPQVQQPQPPTGSLFGSTQPQQTTGGLFGSTQTQPQQTTGGLFGSTQPQTTSLFGQPQQQQQQTQPGTFFGGSLFGNAQQQQPQQSSLFGSTTTNTTNALQLQPTLPANAFGSSANTGGSLGAFGSLSGGSALFSNKPQQPQQQQSSVFGSSSQSTDLSSLGPPPFTKSTKFNDLPDNVRSILENIDTHIQGRIQICKDLQQRKLGDEATKGHEAIRGIQKDLVNASTAIRNDLHVTQDLKAKVDQAVEDTIVATRIIDGFRNPQSGNTYLKDHAGFPLEYFTRITEQMKQRLDWYKTTIEQIERKLASTSHSVQTPQSIAATMQVQHATFVALANKTAAVDAELQKIKALYTQLWRAKTGSVRDPFGDVVKSGDKANDFGFSQLNVR